MFGAKKRLAKIGAQCLRALRPLWHPIFGGHSGPDADCRTSLLPCFVLVFNCKICGRRPGAKYAPCICRVRVVVVVLCVRGARAGKDTVMVNVPCAAVAVVVVMSSGLWVRNTYGAVG